MGPCTMSPGVLRLTMKAVIPLRRRGGSALAKTTICSATGALEMKVFVPVRRHRVGSALSFTATVCIEATSVPASGSVKANAATARPESAPAMKRDFCSADPKVWIG